MLKDTGGAMSSFGDIVAAASLAFPKAAEAFGKFTSAVSNGAGLIKLSATAIKGLWTVISAHPILATVAAVGTLIYAFSELHTSAEEANTEMENAFTVYDDAKQKVADINTELQNAQTELDKLSAKDSLTFVEQQQLEDLREAVELLGIQADLAEREEKAAAKDAAQSAVEAFNKNFVSEGGLGGIFGGTFEELNDENVQALYDEAAYRGFIGYSGDGNLVAAFAEYRLALEKKNAAYEEVKDILKTNKEELTDEQQWQINEYESYSESVDILNRALFDKIGLLSTYSDKLHSLSDIDELTYEQGETLKAIDDMIAYMYGTLDPAKWKQINFDKFFNSESLAGVKQELVNMAKESDNLGISVDDVTSKFPNLESALNNFLSENNLEGLFTIDDIVANINSEAEILNMDVVTEQIKDNFEESVTEATDSVDTEVNTTVTVDTAVDVETDTTSIDEFNAWVDTLDDEYKTILYNLMSTTDTSGWELIDYQEYLNGTANSANDASEALTDLETRIKSTNSAIEGLNAAKSLLSAQGTGESISIEDFSSESLGAYSSALEYNNGVLQLNAEKVHELTEAKVEEEIATNKATKAQKQSEYLKNAGEIERLRKKIDDNNFATNESAESIQTQIDSLLDSNSAIITQCGQLDVLNSNLRESIGLYQAWKNGQDASESGDMFDDTLSAIEKINDVLNNEDSDLYGRVGRKDYQTSLDLIIPENVDKNDETAINNYLDSIDSMFTYDSDGKRSGLNIEEFCQRAVDAGLMVLDEAGESYQVAGGKTMEDFTEGLNLSMPLVQAMFGEMEEFGGQFSWADEAVQTIGDLGITATEAAESLRGIKGNETLKINLDVSDIDTKEGQISALDETIQEMNTLKAQPEVDASEIEYANSIIQYCVAQKQQLNAPTIMSVDTSLVEGKVGEAVSLLQQFQLAQNELEMQASVGMDTTEAQANVDSLLQQIQGLDTNVTAALEIDTTSIDTINTSIAGMTPELLVKAGIDDTAIIGYSPEQKEATVVYDVDHTKVDLYNPNNLTRTVTYNIVTNSSPPSTGTVGINGTAHAYGTANNSLARVHSYGRAAMMGDWGTKKSGTTLVGELGTEIVVDPHTGRWYTVGDNGAEFVNIPKNAIVFNHIQSQSLLEQGYVAARGTALANGTANLSGTAMVTGGIKVSQAKKSTANDKSSSAKTAKTSTDTSSTSKKKSSKDTSSTSKKKSSKDKSSGKETVDWIVRAIEKVERKIKKFQTVAENIYKSFTDRNSALKKQINQVSNEIDLQAQAYERYLAEADSVNLKDSLKKKVRNGTIDIDSYSENTQKKIQEYQDWYDKAQDCKQAIDELNVSLSELYNQQFENVITKWEGKLQDLQHEAERTESIISRRSDYANEYVTPDKAKSVSEENIVSYKELIGNAQSQIEKRASELVELRQKLNEALSDPKSGIVEGSEGYKKMLAEIQDVESEIDGLNSDIISYSNSISEEYMNLFDNAAQGYENKLAQAAHLANEYNHALEMAEAKGYQTSTEYYKLLRDLEEENITIMKEQYEAMNDAMLNALASGEIQQGSQAWYDMVSEIDEVAESIQNAELNIQEFNNSIRDTEWEQFDYLQERISSVSDELEFLIDLMSSSDLFDDKGGFTDIGMATAGLHGQNYNIAMNQADQYAKEIEKINESIESDPYNTELIERREELLEAQRASILAAEDEKQAIIDLVSEGIELELDSLKELINTYKESLDSAKDLYDYQKKVKDQTSEISSLQKQLSAYQGDTSEEAKSKVQKLKVELDAAKDNLEETQYTQYIADQKKLVDEIYDSYEQVLNERLDNVDVLIEEMIATINSNVGSITSTLHEVADSVGYTLSEQMTSTWDNVANQMANDVANRIENTNKVISQLVTNGALSQQNADSIINALAAGDAQGIQNALNIITQLVSNGELSTGHANSILASMSNGDAIAIKNAMDIITQLSANGILSQADTQSILSGLVVGDELSKLHAGQTIQKLSENGIISQQNTAALSTALSTCTGDNSVLATYDKDFSSKLTSVNTTLSGIKTYTDEMIKKAGEEAAAAKALAEAEAARKDAEEKAALEKAARIAAETAKAAAEAALTNKATESAKTTAETSKSTTTTTTTTTKESTSKKTSTGTQGDGKLQVGDKVKFKSGRYYENSYGQGNSGNQKLGKQVYITKINKSGTHPYHISTGTKLGSGDLGWLKKSQLSGYASGLRKALKDEDAWVNELGTESIIKPTNRSIVTHISQGDSVLNAEATKNIWDMANDPSDFIGRHLFNIPQSSDSLSSSDFYSNIGDINIAVHGVSNYEEFVSKLQKDTKFEKMMQAMTIDRAVGKSKLAKHKYKW